MQKTLKEILITGSNGFIANNLKKELEFIDGYNLSFFDKNDNEIRLEELIFKSNIIIHLAGSNIKKNKELLKKNNVKLTKKICDLTYKKFIEKGELTPIIFTSSNQINNENAFGKSKLEAEIQLKNLYKKTSNPVVIYRLPNIFGKWCKPDSNSIIATICHNIANNKRIDIKNEKKNLQIFYIDDLIKIIVDNIKNFPKNFNCVELDSYQINLRDLYNLILEFKDSRKTKLIPKVGEGLTRKLYATYLSYLSSNNFSYPLFANKDNRGSFIEVIKTKSSGQVSFFTAKPGVVRGCHYHNTKNEKFLIIKGEARFRFRNILTQECKEIFVNEDNPTIVESCPGWSHDIKNIGKCTLYVILWANEIFDKDNSDTKSFPTF